MSLYQFDCGHILSISHAGELSKHMTCLSCESEQREQGHLQEHSSETIAKWKQQGEWCRGQRQAWYRSLMHQTRTANVSGYGFVAKSLDIKKGDVSRMERGDSDPAKLVDFWEKERGVKYA